MIHFNESCIEGVEVPGEGGVAVTVKRCAYLPGNGLNGNFFAVELSLTIIKMMHFQIV